MGNENQKPSTGSSSSSSSPSKTNNATSTISSVNLPNEYRISNEFGIENDNNILKSKEDIEFVNKYLLSRCEYKISQTINKYPCRFASAHKKKIYNSMLKHAKKNAKIDKNKVSHFTRWNQINIDSNDINALQRKYKEIFGKNADIDIDNTEFKEQNTQNAKKSVTVHSYKENVFEYDDHKETNAYSVVAWHLNFAHSNLFIAYRGMLLAQDELQVLEHPFLGTIRECMVYNEYSNSEDVPFLTRNATHKYGTPCLFTNVPRQCHFDTTPNKDVKGRERGLYGNAFAKCKDFDGVIESAVHLLKPLTYSNIICIEAPTGGYSEYSLADLDYIFYCALTAFTAARIESEILFELNGNVENNVNVVIHTGNWGTGAYGGNKELMSLLQILAADFAGIDHLVYHTFSKMFTDPYLKALEVRNKFIDQNDGNILYEWEFIRNELFKLKYKWGVSDGN